MRAASDLAEFRRWKRSWLRLEKKRVALWERHGAFVLARERAKRLDPALVALTEELQAAWENLLEQTIPAMASPPVFLHDGAMEKAASDFTWSVRAGALCYERQLSLFRESRRWPPDPTRVQWNEQRDCRPVVGLARSAQATIESVEERLKAALREEQRQEESFVHLLDNAVAVVGRLPDALSRSEHRDDERLRAALTAAHQLLASEVGYLSK
jgi:hypothetical protein